MTFFPYLPSVNRNSKRESNPYLHLSILTFLVSFTDQNKRLRNVKSVFKFLYCGPNVSGIYKFISFLGTEIPFLKKQCPLKFMSGNE